MRDEMLFEKTFISTVQRLVPLGSDFDLLSIDCGGSAGASYDDGKTAITVQGSAVEIVDYLRLAGCPARARIFVREAPFTASREQMAREGEGTKITPATMWGMGYNAGELTVRLETFLIPGAAVWCPMPSTWRSVLGLNRKKNAHQTAREATNEAVWQWAEADSRRRMRTPMGHPAFDEANAYAMGRAGRIAVKSIVKAGQA